MKVIKTKVLNLWALFMIQGFIYSSVAQVVVRDFQARPFIRISKDLGPAWRISLANQLRLEHNATEIDENITELEVSYTPFKKWQFSSGVREIRHLTSSGDFENRIRLHLDAEYTHQIERLDVSFRTRLQSRFDEDEEQSLNDFRARMTFDYNIAKFKLDPFVLGEVDFRLPGRTEAGYESFRLAGGLTWKISTVHRIRLYYMYKREKGDDYPFNAHIVGLGYQIRL